VLCIRCWRRLTEAMDGGAYQAEHGGPLPLWSDQWRGRHGIAPDGAVSDADGEAATVDRSKLLRDRTGRAAS
jgi:hypothetical protein